MVKKLTNSYTKSFLQSKKMPFLRTKQNLALFVLKGMVFDKLNKQ